MHMHGRTRYALTAALLLGAWATATVQAAGFSWSGSGGDSLWTTTNNWSLTSGTDDDGMPDADDDVTFPTGAASGVQLDGNQACNSLTISGGSGFTIGPAGDTLTVTSGSLSRNYDTTAQHIIACNLQLNSPTGTNTISVTHKEDYNNANQEVRITGVVTTSGILRKTGNSGKVRLTNAASTFGGGPRIEGGVLEIDSVPLATLFGTSPVALHDAGTLYVRGLSQTVNNTFLLTGSGVPRIVAYSGTLTLAGDIDIPTGRTLQLGHSGSDLIILNNQFTGTGNLQTMRNGVEFNSTDQFTQGNFLVGQSGGTVILTNLSWTVFTNYFHNGYGTGARRWQLGGQAGFAARGQPLIIEGSGAVGGGANAKTWFNESRSFGGYWNDKIRQRADARVEVNVNTELTARRDWYSSGHGPGLTGTHDESLINRFNGNITDQVAANTGTSKGALRFGGSFSNDEMVLAGTNDWVVGQ